MVEPVDPLEGGVLDVVQALPAGVVSGRERLDGLGVVADHFGLHLSSVGTECASPGTCCSEMYAGLVWSYCFIVSFAFGSRFAPLQLALVAVGYYFFRRSKRILVVGAIISWIVSQSILILRLSLDEGGQGGFGLIPSTAALGRLTPLETTGCTILNVFSGGFMMAEAMSVPAQYPEMYKLSSYSPLPSAIDEFNRVRAAEVRFNVFAPFGSVAEAWHFGWGYVALFMMIVTLALALGDYLWIRRGPAVGAIMIAPLMFAFIRMYQYQLRSTVRWMLLGVAAILVVDLLVSRQRLRAASPTAAR